MTSLKRTLLLGLTVILVVCLFAACAPSKGTVGTYTFESASKEVSEVDKETKEKTTKVVSLTEKETGLQLKVELKDSGVAKITVNGKSDTGTWTETGDKISVVKENVSYEFQHVDNKLVLTIDGVTITLSK